MDVDSLYPSMKTVPTAAVIKETVIESDIEVSGLNIKEMLIFIGKKCDQ